MNRSIRKILSRRELLAGSAAAGAVVVLRAEPAAAADGQKTFTILHTNDLHSNLIGMGPASDYTPFSLNDDATRGGFARLATLIAKRKVARAGQGPVLVLDAGDYSMGTAFAGATRETGAELQLLSRMGCDATTFGNHDFDLGPDGTARSIAAAANADHVPAVVASNTDFTANDATLVGLQRLAKDGFVRRYVVIERGGIRFGIFGLLGKEAQLYTDGAGAVTFADPIEAAQKMVKLLRETEKVDVIIALSHGGVEKGTDGRFTDGEDVRIPKAVPGIDVVIGAHSHTELHEAIIVNGRTPVVQTGKYGQNLGELVIALDGSKLTVESYKLYPIDLSYRRYHRRGRSHHRRDRQVQENGHRGRVRVTRLPHRSAAGGGASGYSKHVHRHRRWHYPRQPLHRRLPKRHQGGHWFYRQRDDAVRPYPGKVGRADRLRRVRRGAARCWCGGPYAREYAHDGLLYRPGLEAGPPPEKWSDLNYVF